MRSILAVTDTSAYSVCAGMLSGPGVLPLLICLMATLISSIVGGPTSIGRSVGAASMLDADFSNDPLLCNDILKKFEETVSEEANLDVIPNIICPHNAFVFCGKLVQSEAQVLNDLDFDYDSDDFTSTAVYPYHAVTSIVYSSQCEKYVLNEATSFITSGHEDPTLFRGMG
ncbi:unnamed protein product [Schistosoma mattheei]|uniref:Uncharacterized protein n=1 Tax=Schistosoma mattheei TaxID=31246 RepID=A0A183PGV1_9TREM|nr:unnamed protein product [Schistosoma mattheei]